MPCVSFLPPAAASGFRSRRLPLRALSLLLVLVFLDLRPGEAASRALPRIIIACNPENDLLGILENNRWRPARYDTPEQAIQAATAGSVVLLLAEGYPARLLEVTPEQYEQARRKDLRLLVEFPSFVPGITLGGPRKTEWERMVVSTKDWSPSLMKDQILMAHDCHVIPAISDDAWLVSARVAGYDHAVYGIPAPAQPVLFPLPGGKVLIATTRLSGFLSGRYAPADRWTAVWRQVFIHLTGQAVPSLNWRPIVRATFGPRERLPGNFERLAFRRSVDWVESSGLLMPEARWPALSNLMVQGIEMEYAPLPSGTSGDGRRGILEGYASNIRHDGRQPLRLPLRADCQAETAMGLALKGRVHRNGRQWQIASNLLDFLYFNSDLCSGPRGDPAHPAFGLIGWGSTMPLWKVANYGDDNARTMLATLLAAGSLGSSRWDEPLLRALVANLRTTGTLGFRGDRVDMAPLEHHGWRHFHDAHTVNDSPHFEAYSWACFLWAYRQTGQPEFLDKTKRGIRLMMEGYPEKWRWNDNMERARMLLCLAWLVRIEDTAEHRHWTRRVAEDLIASQHASGALRERFRSTPGSHYQIPASNEAYGTGEAPLLHQNGDPVSDQLYVGGFALLGLHEAAAALADERLRSAADRLVEFLCRIQIAAPTRPELHGAWFRAFDFEKWEPWASSGDAGWGAWSIEAGWAQAWTTGVLGLRLLHTTLWELSSGTRIREVWPQVERDMAKNSGAPWTARATGP